MCNPPQHVTNDQQLSVQQTMYIQDQEDLAPLTTAMLEAASPQERRDMLGARLYPRIELMNTAVAPKITGMLLELDNNELLHLLDNNQCLEARVQEAVALLQAHLTAWMAATQPENE